MKYIQTLLLLVSIAGIFYCVRMLRALHTKVSTSTSKLTKSLNEQKTQNQHAYRQLEAFYQLISLLKFTAPIPPTRGWVASPDLLLTMTDVIRTHKPRLVVELGSGVSTLVIAKAGAKKFAIKTRAMLKEHGVRGVEVRVAPLASHGSGVDWYDTSKLGDIKGIDLLFIDGPPGSNSPNARKPALQELLGRLSPKAVIIMDDVKRPAERELAEAFAKALPSHVLTFHDHEKGTAVISPK
jgi:predicted O-methyltransferase YrrM